MPLVAVALYSSSIAEIPTHPTEQVGALHIVSMISCRFQTNSCVCAVDAHCLLQARVSLHCVPDFECHMYLLPAILLLHSRGSRLLRALHANEPGMLHALLLIMVKDVGEAAWHLMEAGHKGHRYDPGAEEDAAAYVSAHK